MIANRLRRPAKEKAFWHVGVRPYERYGAIVQNKGPVDYGD
jgi:hypothetical protein